MLDKTLLKKIAKDLIIGNPIKIGQIVEGQQITENNCYLLGCKAGPGTHVEYLLHEIAHLAEREIPKLLEFPQNWGFYYGKFWEATTHMGYHSGWEPETDASVLREARVWGYQLSIMRHYQLPITSKELASSAVYLPAFCLYKYKRANVKEDDAALEQLSKLIDENSKIYTHAHFIEAWNTRMETLKSKKSEYKP
jgi:hypothetical protein